jgi:CspA family cold shock protein
MIGTVKSYNARRGMGEISPDGGGPDVAVYVSEVERAGFARLDVGQRLSYALQTDRMSQRSFAVRLEEL